MKAGGSASTVQETPGNPTKPASFLNLENNEQKLACYLGFSDLADLRSLTTSWPVLKAIIAFDPIALNLNKTTTFHLLHAERDKYENAQDYRDRWPIDESDATKAQKSKKARYLACILTTLETDLESLREVDHENHQSQHDLWRGEFKVRFPSLVVANRDYTKVLLKSLGPYGQPCIEDRLEKTDRAWNLLKSARFHIQNNLWNARLAQNKLIEQTIVQSMYKPKWMAPPPAATSTPQNFTRAAAVMEADELSKRNFPIVWEN